MPVSAPFPARALPLKRDGFSMIEILVTVGIIAVLAALLLPVGGQMVNKAKQTACVNNLRQLEMGFVAYRGEHNNCFPGAGLATDATGRWMQSISPYLGLPDSTAQNNAAYYQPVFHCPLVPPWAYRKGASTAGYGIYGTPSKAMNGGQGWSGVEIVTYNSTTGLSYFAINKPATKVLLADKIWNGYKGIGLGGPGLATVAPYPTQADGAAANHRPDHDPSKGPAGGCNYLFADGHVEMLTAWPGADAFDASK